MKKFYFLSAMMLLTILSFAQNTIDNAFFDKVSYKGAFGATDWTSGWANFDPQNSTYAATTVTVAAGNISANTTWTADKVYLLNGFVYVKSGFTLTIEPGTVIRGDKVNKGTLIVEMGAKLVANGTVDKPIVFTSNQAAGSRSYGDWGGIIICGKAPINQAGGSALIEGGVNRNYGGTSPDDNSGSLKYVRLEFPGVEFSLDNEINGLTMGGVGKGTTLDYIQISYCGDDSYEWFGGNVNAKHLISFRSWDDDFDTDNGFSGMVQYAVALRDPNTADKSKSNGFESDNDATGSPNEPFTQAVFSNFSMFGPKPTTTTAVNSFHDRGMHIRRNSRLNVYNSIFSGWVKGLFIDGTPSQTAATENKLKIENSTIAGASSKFFEDAFARTYFTKAERHNDTLITNADLKITDPFNLSVPNFLPLSGSPALAGSIWDIAKSVTFMVNDGTNPISGAKVTLGSTMLTTDAAGKAIFNTIVAGTYNYTVEATQYVTKTGSVTMANADLTETISLVYIIPAADITFTINDGINAIAGAKVTIGTQTITTDAAGKAVFADMQPNTYAYIVEAASYTTATGNVTISGTDVNKTVSLVYIIPAADITFMVKDGSNAIAGAIVTIGATSKTTDATGKATFEQLAPNTYAYTVEAADYKTKTGSVVLNGVNVTETVSLIKNEVEKFSVLFAVRNSKTQLPVEDADVTMNNTTMATDINGFASFDQLTPTIYSYQVSKEDYEQVSSTVEVKDKDVVVNVSFKYLKYNVKFVVKDVDTELVVAGATVELGSTSLTTDGAGVATFEKIADGTYDYTVSKTGYESKSAQVTVNGDDIEVSVAIKAVVGVNETAQDLISVYPNPVSNELYINSSKEISEVVIYNVTGQVIMQTVNQNMVDVSGLEKGLYLITIASSDGNKQTQRILKQ